MTMTADGPLTIVPGITRARGQVVLAASPALTLVWDDGVRTPIDVRTVVGRNPVAVAARAVAVRDETLSISRSHFEIGVTEGRIWVCDLASTNGVRVRRGGEVHDLVPRQHHFVRAGDILEVGDRWVKIEGGR